MATACLFAVVFLVQFDALVAISGPAPTAPQYCDALKTHCPINPISASDPQKKCLLNTCSIQGGPGVFGTCMYGSEQCNTNADCTCVCEGATSTKCENYASPTTAICDSKVACVPLTASGAVQACVHDICIKSSSGSPQGHCQHDTSAPCTSNSDTSCVCSSTYAPCVAVATMSPTPQPTAMCPSTVKCPDPTQACVKQDCVMSTPGALWGHARWDVSFRCQSDGDCGCVCETSKAHCTGPAPPVPTSPIPEACPNKMCPLEREECVYQTCLRTNNGRLGLGHCSQCGSQCNVDEDCSCLCKYDTDNLKTRCVDRPPTTKHLTIAPSTHKTPDPTTGTASNAPTPTLTASATIPPTLPLTEPATIPATPTLTVLATIPPTLPLTASASIAPTPTLTASATIPPTLPLTVPPTLPVTVPPTLPLTVPLTIPPTLPLTEPATVAATPTLTVLATIPPTLPLTIPPTLPLTVAPTLPLTVPPTLPLTVPLTVPPTLPVTIPPTLPVTVPLTVPPTLPLTASATIPPTLPLTVPLTVPPTLPLTASASVAPTPTLTASATIPPTLPMTASASIAPTPTLTASATIPPTLPLTEPAATPTLTASATIPPTLPLTASATIVPTLPLTEPATPTLTASATIPPTLPLTEPAATPTFTASATIAPTLPLTASATIAPTPTLTASAPIAPTLPLTEPATPTLTASATIPPTLPLTEPPTVAATPTLTASATIAATPTLTASATIPPTLPLTEPPTVAATPTLTASATIPPTLPLTASATIPPTTEELTIAPTPTLPPVTLPLTPEPTTGPVTVSPTPPSSSSSTFAGSTTLVTELPTATPTGSTAGATPTGSSAPTTEPVTLPGSTATGTESPTATGSSAALTAPVTLPGSSSATATPTGTPTQTTAPGSSTAVLTLPVTLPGSSTATETLPGSTSPSTAPLTETPTGSSASPSATATATQTLTEHTPTATVPQSSTQTATIPQPTGCCANPSGSSCTNDQTASSCAHLSDTAHFIPGQECCNIDVCIGQNIETDSDVSCPSCGFCQEDLSKACSRTHVGTCQNGGCDLGGAVVEGGCTVDNVALADGTFCTETSTQCTCYTVNSKVVGALICSTTTSATATVTETLTNAHSPTSTEHTPTTHSHAPPSTENSPTPTHSHAPPTTEHIPSTVNTVTATVLLTPSPTMGPGVCCLGGEGVCSSHIPTDDCEPSVISGEPIAGEASCCDPNAIMVCKTIDGRVPDVACGTTTGTNTPAHTPTQTSHHASSTEHASTTHHPTTEHASTTHHPTTEHASTTHHPTTEHASTTHHPTTEHASTTHHPTTEHASTTHHPTTEHASTTHHATTEHSPSTTHHATTVHSSTTHTASHPAPTPTHTITHSSPHSTTHTVEHTPTSTPSPTTAHMCSGATPVCCLLPNSGEQRECVQMVTCDLCLKNDAFTGDGGFAGIVVSIDDPSCCSAPEGTCGSVVAEAPYDFCPATTSGSPTHTTAHTATEHPGSTTHTTIHAATEHPGSTTHTTIHASTERPVTVAPTDSPGQCLPQCPLQNDGVSPACISVDASEVNGVCDGNNHCNVVNNLGTLTTCGTCNGDNFCKCSSTVIQSPLCVCEATHGTSSADSACTKVLAAKKRSAVPPATSAPTECGTCTNGNTNLCKESTTVRGICGIGSDSSFCDIQKPDGETLEACELPENNECATTGQCSCTFNQPLCICDIGSILATAQFSDIPVDNLCQLPVPPPPSSSSSSHTVHTATGTHPPSTSSGPTIHTAHVTHPPSSSSGPTIHTAHGTLPSSSGMTVHTATGTPASTPPLIGPFCEVNVDTGVCHANYPGFNTFLYGAYSSDASCCTTTVCNKILVPGTCSVSTTHQTPTQTVQHTPTQTVQHTPSHTPTATSPIGCCHKNDGSRACFSQTSHAECFAKGIGYGYYDEMTTDPTCCEPDDHAFCLSIDGQVPDVVCSRTTTAGITTTPTVTVTHTPAPATTPHKVDCSTPILCGPAPGCIGGPRAGFQCSTNSDCPSGTCRAMADSCTSNTPCADCLVTGIDDSLHTCKPCVFCDSTHDYSTNTNEQTQCCPSSFNAPYRLGCDRTATGGVNTCGLAFSCDCATSGCGDACDAVANTVTDPKFSAVCAQVKTLVPHLTLSRQCCQPVIYGSQEGESTGGSTDYYLVTASRPVLEFDFTTAIPEGCTMTFEVVSGVNPCDATATDLTETISSAAPFFTATFAGGTTPSFNTCPSNALSCNLPECGVYLVVITMHCASHQCVPYDFSYVSKKPACPAALCSLATCHSSRDCVSGSCSGCSASSGRCLEHNMQPPQYLNDSCADAAPSTSCQILNGISCELGSCAVSGSSTVATCTSLARPMPAYACDCECPIECTGSSDCAALPGKVALCDVETGSCVYRQPHTPPSPPVTVMGLADPKSRERALADGTVALAPLTPSCAQSALDAGERAFAAQTMDRFGGFDWNTGASRPALCGTLVDTQFITISAISAPVGLQAQCCISSTGVEGVCFGGAETGNQTGRQWLTQANEMLHNAHIDSQRHNTLLATERACCAGLIYAALGQACGRTGPTTDAWSLANTYVSRSFNGQSETGTNNGPIEEYMDDGHLDLDNNDLGGQLRVVELYAVENRRSLVSGSQLRAINVHSRLLARGGGFTSSYVMLVGNASASGSVVVEQTTTGSTCSNRDKQMAQAVLNVTRTRSDVSRLAPLPGRSFVGVFRTARSGALPKGIKAAECTTIRLSPATAGTANCPLGDLAVLYPTTRSALPDATKAILFDRLTETLSTTAYREPTANTQKGTKFQLPVYVVDASIIVQPLGAVGDISPTQSIRFALRNEDCGVTVLGPSLAQPLQVPLLVASGSPLSVRIPIDGAGFAWTSEGNSLIVKHDSVARNCIGGADSGVATCSNDEMCAVGGTCSAQPVRTGVAYPGGWYYYDCLARHIDCSVPADADTSQTRKLCCSEKVQRWYMYPDNKDLLYSSTDYKLALDAQKK